MKTRVIGPTERQLTKDRNWYESAYFIFGTPWLLQMDTIQSDAIREDESRCRIQKAKEESMVAYGSEVRIERELCEECGGSMCGSH
jgi:hypothetical protein